MIHARRDYNRIQDPGLADPSLLGENCSPIAEDEPVFLLRARDLTAPATILHWVDLNRPNGDPELCRVALEHVQRMLEWQEEHGAKLPDCPPSAIELQGVQPEEAPPATTKQDDDPFSL